jgi:hypothetical protein
VYGFDPVVGHCVRFFYGGCEGNANRFDTLGECEAECGGSELGECPETQPEATMSSCMPAGLECTYTWQDRCLCARGGTRVCSKIDPECPNVLSDVPPPDDGDCVGDDCVSRIVIPTNYACECNAEAGWQCIAQI